MVSGEKEEAAVTLRDETWKLEGIVTGCFVGEKADNDGVSTERMNDLLSRRKRQAVSTFDDASV
jgi:hypothetical protein